MEKGDYISDLKNGGTAEGVFVVNGKTALRETRNGKLFFNLELMDKSGKIPAVHWDATEGVYSSVSPNDYVFVRGRVGSYQNQLQMSVFSVVTVDPEELDAAEFMPTTPKGIPALKAQLIEQMGRVKNEYFSKLLHSFFDDEDFMARFSRCPAAVTYHHSYIGGLLEHSVSVARLSESVLAEHPDLNADLLVTGCLLHDMGKVEELEFDRKFGYTDPGMLLGHLIQAVQMIDHRAAEIEGFPKNLLMELSHLILSHHGEYEFGSPKLPMTGEAIVLHFLDNMDAKVNAYHRSISESIAQGSNFTEWNRMFDRRLYKRPEEEQG